MIKLNQGVNLYQWDTGRSVTVDDADKVQFACKGDSVAVSITPDAGGTAKIPDKLLQTGRNLHVFTVRTRGYDQEETTDSAIFIVKARPRPKDYVPTAAEETIGELVKLTEKAQDAIQAAEEAAAMVTGFIDDMQVSGEKVWSSEKVSGELEKLAGRRDVTASSLVIGSQLSDDVIITSEEDGSFSVLNVEKFADVPFPHQNEKRVILRNIAPGTADDDAATVGQLKATDEKVAGFIQDDETRPDAVWSSEHTASTISNVASQLIASTGASITKSEEKLREEMGEKRALHASTLRVGDTVINDVLIQAKQNEADDKGNLVGVLDFTSFVYRGKNVVLRNIAPGKENNDAVNLVQLQEKVNETKPIIVTLFNGENSASHTAKEIKAFSDDGRPVFCAVYSDEIGEYTGELLNLSSVSNNAACFSSVTVLEQYAREDKYVVDENGFFQYDYTITNNVTEEQLDYAVENLVTKEQFNGAVGDMETALDAIIAIQNELIGGETITFYVNSKAYTAIPGMYWGDWVDSKYNTEGFEIIDGVYVHNSYGDTIYNPDGNIVAVDDVIIADGNYTT